MPDPSMIVLALDTAGVDCSAALYDSASGRVLCCASEAIGKGHAERLMEIIDQVLDKAGMPMSAIGRVAVVIGPGSFTGIRVGVSAARGLALALGVDCVGVTTLEALAGAYLAKTAARPVVVAMDAKRDEIYTQVFSAEGIALNEPAAVSADQARALASAFSADLIGSWADQAGPASEDEFAGRDRFDIATVARIGARVSRDAARPKPLYLRGPDAKPQTGFALARA